MLNLLSFSRKTIKQPDFDIFNAFEGRDGGDHRQTQHRLLLFGIY